MKIGINGQIRLIFCRVFVVIDQAYVNYYINSRGSKYLMENCKTGTFFKIVVDSTIISI